MQLKNKTLLCKLMYLYIYVILYEGILRKWILPSLSTPIMVVKILIAFFIVWYGRKYWSFFSGWEKSFSLVGLCVFITTLLFGHKNLGVDIWGCIPYWLGLNVCFIMSKELKEKDINYFVKLIVFTSIVNSFIMILQFNSPTTSFINSTNTVLSDHIAENDIADLAGAFRPSGIFYHSTHNNLFILLSLSLIIYSFKSKSINLRKSTIYLSFILSFIAVFCSVSRTCIFYFFGVAIYTLIMYSRQGVLNTVLKVSVILLLIVIPIYTTGVLDRPINTLTKRFTDASASQYYNQTAAQGTISDIYYRTILYNVKALIDPHTLDGEEVPFWGFGQGLSTQVGGKLANVQEHAGFALAEFDGLRIMCESGYLFGWIIIFIRLGYSLRFIPRLFQYRKEERFLTLFLYPSFLISFFLLNTWGNAFLSNFAFMSGGIFLASLKKKLG